ncbi:UNVERIFIED_CONTAM: hypothetical protein Sindi_2273000, partial [Sesamum indicum]
MRKTSNAPLQFSTLSSSSHTHSDSLTATSFFFFTEEEKLHTSLRESVFHLYWINRLLTWSLLYEG